MAEETDLNEEELDLNVSRKMSIRALNVATMLKFRPTNRANPAPAATALTVVPASYPAVK